MASRRPKKDKRKKDRRPKRLFKQDRGPAIPPGSEGVYTPAGREKMSEVLEEFIEPYQRMIATGEDLQKLLCLAVLAWNAAILPEDQRRQMIDDTLKAGLKGASKQDRADAETIIETMVLRKQEHFAANRRAIVSFEVTNTGKDFQLSVVSTL